ncbi:MAG: amidohydrolase family protein [Clostridiales bacterium]|nr:amidohydrolase family protein [Clostridiales bacterium]
MEKTIPSNIGGIMGYRRNLDKYEYPDPEEIDFSKPLADLAIVGYIQNNHIIRQSSMKFYLENRSIQDMNTMKNSFGIIDSHEHVLLNTFAQSEEISQIWDKCSFDSACLLSTQGIGYITQNIKCLLLKIKYPHVYAFGGLEHYQFNRSCGKPDYLKQIKRMDALGFDGVKMIEGKPIVRQKLNKRLDDGMFDAFYSYAQDHSITITFHVADPPTFWNKELIPDWALKEGWYYGTGEYIPYRQFYEEIEGILKKHPNLKMILAHFFFLSEDINEAKRFLNTYPNICFDLTPGTEMYFNFTRDTDRWRQFFSDYQDRLIFGTDITDEDTNNLSTSNLARNFLEMDETFVAFGVNVSGLGLDKPIIQKIYRDNFLRMAGDRPKRVCIKEAIAECQWVKEYIDNLELLDLSYFDSLLYQDKDKAYYELREIEQGFIKASKSALE